jgi:hypothetical protein
MEFFIVVVAGMAAAFIVMAIHEIATEVRGMRSVLETHYQLERVPVRSDKRKGVDL